MTTRRALAFLWVAGISAPALTGSANAQLPDEEPGPRLVVQTGHQGYGAILAVALSPDGRYLLTGGPGGAVVLWHVERLAQVRRYAGHRTELRPGWPTPEEARSVAFSPDGRTFLSGGDDGMARLWEVASGVELKRFEHVHPLHAVAFTPDGRQVLTGSADGTARLWELASGTIVRRFEGHSDPVTAVGISSDGRYVVTGSRDGTARIWQSRDGAEVARLENEAEVTSVAFSSDGRRVATGSGDGAHLWDVATESRLRSLGRESRHVASVAFTPDGARVLTAESAGVVSFDAETGEELDLVIGHGPTGPLALSGDGSTVVVADGDRVSVSSLEKPAPDVSSMLDIEDPVAFERAFGQYLGDMLGYRLGPVAESADFVELTRDGRHLMARGRTSAHVWDIETGTRISRIDEGCMFPEALSLGGRQLLATHCDRSVSLRSLLNDEPIRRFDWRIPVGSVIAIAPDGARVLTGFPDGETGDHGSRIARADSGLVVLWDAESGEEIRHLEGHSEQITAATFSSDGRRVLTASLDGTVRLWDAGTGEPLRDFAPDSGRFLSGWTSVALSPDGRYALGVPRGGGWEVLVWEIESVGSPRILRGHTGPITAVSSPADGVALTASQDETARLWDLETGTLLRRFEDHGDRVTSVASSREVTFVATGSGDGIPRLFDAATGDLLASLVSLRDDGWAVIAPDGRFDTNDLERIEGLHWVLPDEPLTPLSVEVFLRDYYEPRLLPRILAGEWFPALGGLERRNRVQPEVRVSGVTLGDTTAAVTVEVKAHEGYFRGGFEGGPDSVRVESGLADLRLFRDGKVVRYIDGPLDLDPGTGATRITFEGIRIPRVGADSVSFSAYAFNEDYTSANGSSWIGRVKSATDNATVALPDGMAARPGRAYLVTVGVDAYEDPAWDLAHAANDAWAFSEELSERLAGHPDYESVVPVRLTSTHDGERSTDATKSTIRGVFDLLAGRKLGRRARARIPNADRIRRATPEDLVIVTFSSHGYADSLGTFYLFPSDIGEGTGKRVTPGLLERAVSSEEMAAWLRDVDAGEMVLIVDACHSAAAVEGAGFKPGPMGSRGFGQMAFDKRMRVLAASQAEEVALESEILKQGLLTHALVRDGLESGQADHAPANGVIGLGEWLRYGVERVPDLFEEVMRGEVQTFGRPRDPTIHGGGQDPHFQQPALFDFRRSTRDRKGGTRLTPVSGSW